MIFCGVNMLWSWRSKECPMNTLLTYLTVKLTKTKTKLVFLNTS